MSKFTSFDSATSVMFPEAPNFSNGDSARVMYISQEQQKKISLALCGDTSDSLFTHFSIMINGLGAQLSYRINDEDNGGYTDEMLFWEDEEIALAVERILNKLDDDGVVDWINVSIMTSQLI